MCTEAPPGISANQWYRGTFDSDMFCLLKPWEPTVFIYPFFARVGGGGVVLRDAARLPVSARFALVPDQAWICVLRQQTGAFGRR